MKTTTSCRIFHLKSAGLAFLISLLPSLALAQLTENQRIGAYAGSGGGESAEQKQAREQRGMSNALGGHAYRRIDGKIQYMPEAGSKIHVKAESKASGGILIVQHQKPFGGQERYAIKNYKGEAVSGRELEILAMYVGTYNYGSETIELYDCGAILSPAEERELSAKLRGQVAAAQKAAQEKVDAARRIAAENQKLAAEAALKSDQAEAEKGDAYGLLRMGERYRDGDGVEKDSAKAEEYLTKAAKAGSPAAVRALAELNQAATNAPAKQ